FEAVGHIGNLEVLLAKGLVASSAGMDAALLGDIWRQAFAAQASLNQLPLPQGTLSRTASFLTQLGDFSFMLARRAAEGRPATTEHRETLARLRSEAAVLDAELRRLADQAGDGPAFWSRLAREIQTAPRGAALGGTEVAGGDFARVDKRMSEFPTLTYDGPFSDHVRNRRPLGLGDKRIDRADAQRIALQFLGEGDGVVAATVGDVDARGPMPAFAVEIRRRDGGAVIARLDVTKQGGEVVWMLRPRSIDSARLTNDEAIAKARAFLAERGLSDAVPTFVARSENRAVIPFVPRQGEVLLYPDQVKVTVALDNGEVIGYEARAFLLSHRRRELPNPRLTAAEAVRTLRSELEMEGTPRLALIPREDLSEVLTYEVPARLEDERFLIYVNALDGRQERILQIVPTPGGQLTL
ncbi:MAG TPA: germination protein YpeB, partial [Limnochordia bacterium]